MTEDEARAYLADSVSRETLRRLEVYVDVLLAEAGRQNLVSTSTLDQLWARHIVDSAQLVPLGPTKGLWVDLGSGAGLPGLVVAMMRDSPTFLIEPRAKRAAFLLEAVERLALAGRVEVIRARAEAVPIINAGVISARAVAPLSNLFSMGSRLADRSTVWVLPKGQRAVSEVALAERSWQADYRLVASITDSSASIIVATNVRRKKGATP